MHIIATAVSFLIFHTHQLSDSSTFSWNNYKLTVRGLPLFSSIVFSSCSVGITALLTQFFSYASLFWMFEHAHEWPAWSFHVLIRCNKMTDFSQEMTSSGGRCYFFWPLGGKTLMWQYILPGSKESKPRSWLTGTSGKECLFLGLGKTGGADDLKGAAA